MKGPGTGKRYGSTIEFKRIIGKLSSNFSWAASQKPQVSQGIQYEHFNVKTW